MRTEAWMCLAGTRPFHRAEKPIVSESGTIRRKRSPKGGSDALLGAHALALGPDDRRADAAQEIDLGLREAASSEEPPRTHFDTSFLSLFSTILKDHKKSKKRIKKDHFV